MFQNKLLFNQSSASLEIIGLPDYSNNENKDQISIISQWKLTIVNFPPIEGDIDHLKSIMEAFYNYSNFLISGENAIYESKLINIKSDNNYQHRVLFMSSKDNVKPLNIKIGNTELVDIISCFDQFNSSKKVKTINFNFFKKSSKNNFLNLFNKENFSNLFLPPLISICTLFLFSSTFLYFYKVNENNENKELINTRKINL